MTGSPVMIPSSTRRVHAGDHHTEERAPEAGAPHGHAAHALQGDAATRAAACQFLRDLIEAVPYKVHTVLTDNGIQFCHPPRYRNGPTARYMGHLFDRICAEHGIEHRLTKPNHPWTNGQVERMNRTLKDATVKRYHYESHDRLCEHLATFVDAYNFRQAPEDPTRPHALRAHRPMLDRRARTLHTRSSPSHAGTEHLGFGPINRLAT